MEYLTEAQSTGSKAFKKILCVLRASVREKLFSAPRRLCGSVFEPAFWVEN